jgi:hypothetical protein
MRKQMRMKALQVRLDVREPHVVQLTVEEKVKTLAAANLTVVRGGGNVPWPEPPPQKGR